MFLYREVGQEAAPGFYTNQFQDFPFFLKFYVIPVHSRDLVSSSNINQPGVYVFRIDSNNIILPSESFMQGILSCFKLL